MPEPRNPELSDQDAGPTECMGTRTECGSYWHGHNIHFIHAKRLTQHPWGWRDAIITRVEGQTATAQYLGTPVTLTLWHHRPLTRVVTVGEPVRIHEQYYALGCPNGWYSLHIEGGLGPVPKPDDWEDAERPTQVEMVNLETGVAEPIDHLSAEQREK